MKSRKIRIQTKIASERRDGMEMMRVKKSGGTRRKEFKLAKAKKGKRGNGLQRAVVHDLHSHTGSPDTPMPAHLGS